MKFDGETKAELILADLNELYYRKNLDYGNAFGLGFREWGDVSYFVRASDKLNRFETLVSQKQERMVQDETVLDTVEDLLNYTIMYGMETMLQKSPLFHDETTRTLHTKVCELIMKHYYEPVSDLQQEINDVHVRYTILKGLRHTDDIDAKMGAIIRLCVNLLQLLEHLK